MEINNNRLTVIPNNAFYNLSAFNASDVQIMLDNNHIYNIELDAFSGVEQVLTFLNLNNNNLTHLPLALKKLSSLHTMYILGNPLLSLDASVLASLSNKLNIFRISIEKVASFPNELRYLTALSKLRMYNITVPMLHSAVFHGFENTLTFLEMSFTSFESIPSAFCRLKSLKTFLCEYSPNLSNYDLSIFDECSHPMTTVTGLSLMHNKLTTMPKLDAVFPKLEYLYLNGNALHYIADSSLTGLTSLVAFDISYNAFTHIPFAVNEATSLQYLNVEHNKIETVEEMDLMRLHNLTHIYLMGNPIVYVSPHAFLHNPWLSAVFLENTTLGHIPLAVIGLGHFSQINLSGKPIECSCNAMSNLKSWNVSEVEIRAKCNSGNSVKTYLTSELPKCP